MRVFSFHVHNDGPAEFHRRLKAGAAMEGMSMFDSILREIGEALERPTHQELLARVRAQSVRRLEVSPADVIRVERDGR
jgi:hypothetical protein